MGVVPKADGRDPYELHDYVPPRAMPSCERFMGNELLLINNKLLLIISFHDRSSVTGYRTAAEMDFLGVLLAYFLLNVKRYEYCGIKFGHKGRRYVSVLTNLILL